MLDCLSRAVDPDVAVPWPDAADGRSPMEKEMDRLHETARLVGGNSHGLKYAYGARA